MKKICVACFMLIFIAACQSSESRVEETGKALPLPDDAVLLSSQVEQHQGSQDACYFTVLTELYGSDWSYEKIEDFYVDSLVNEGWIKVSPAWLPQGRFYFRLGDDYKLGISEATIDDIDLQFESVDPQTVASYDTAYTLTLTYADVIARRNCPAWDEGS